MAALLLSNGHVQRPTICVVEAPSSDLGSGAVPQLNVLDWENQDAYDADIAAAAPSQAVYVQVAVPGFDPGSALNVSAAISALQALGGIYAGSSVIG